MTHFSAITHSSLTAGQGSKTQTRTAYLIAKVTHMAFKTGGRKCKFESLENRQMMAGDVMAAVHAGTLFIKGDNLSNGITITPGAIPNQVIITGINAGGSGTTVNGLTNTAVPINNVTMDIKIKMLRGNDIVTVNNLTVNGSLKINTDGGVDTVTVNASTICGDLDVNTGGSADTVTVTNTLVNGEAEFRTGGDCDHLTITASTLGELDVHLEEGNDTLAITNTQVVTETSLNGDQGINTFMNGGSNFFSGIYNKKNLNG